VPATITLPVAAELINVTVTVIVLKNNRVELDGAVADEAIGEAILKAGLERLHQWHAQQRAAALVKTNGGLLGPDGLPLSSEGLP
jgi:hypothetical protein